MKKRMKILMYSLLLPALFSCRDTESSSPPASGEELSVIFQLGLPSGMDRPVSSSRAMQEGEENRVDTIDVLSFLKGPGGVYRYEYHAPGTNYVVQDQYGVFHALLRQYPDEQIFLILVNARSLIALAAPRGGEPLEDVSRRLVCVDKHEWKADNDGSGTVCYIPMYAKSLPVSVTASTTSIGRYDLLRMLARIDIRLKIDIPDFLLREAMVFNRMACGYLPYRDADWDDTEKAVLRSYVPTVLPGGGEVTIEQPSVTYRTDPVTHRIERGIYTFEAAGAVDREQATCIVVGGYYGYPANQSELTYYRIDIPPSQSGYVSGEIRRNHLYDVEIQSVAGPGALSPENAFEGEAMLQATVTAWTSNGMGVVIDPQYKLTLDKDRIEAGGNAFVLPVLVRTDHPQGIVVSAVRYISGSGWLTVGGGRDGDLSRTLSVEAGVNFDGFNRQAAFTITAGNMNYTFQVTQAEAVP